MEGSYIYVFLYQNSTALILQHYILCHIESSRCITLIEWSLCTDMYVTHIIYEDIVNLHVGNKEDS